MSSFAYNPGTYKGEAAGYGGKVGSRGKSFKR